MKKVNLILGLSALFMVAAVAAPKMDVKEHDKEYDQKNVTSYQKGLPQLYVCGDSISVGYTPFLKEELKGKFSVVHRRDLAKLFPKIPKVRYSGKGQSLVALTKHVLESKEYKPDYLLLNCGLHDIARGGANLEKYKETLLSLIEMAKANGVQLIWVTTTPKETGHKINGKVIIFNATAREIMKKNHIPVVDLHACVLMLFEKYGEKKIMQKDGVHYTPLGYELQAKFIVAELKKQK